MADKEVFAHDNNEACVAGVHKRAMRRVAILDKTSPTAHKPWDLSVGRVPTAGRVNDLRSSVTEFGGRKVV